MVEYCEVVILTMMIYAEKEFSGGLWFSKAVEGINDSARKRNISIRFVDFDELSLDVFVNLPKILVIIGASDANLQKIIQFCAKNSIKTLLVNYFAPEPTHLSSCVVMDYQDTMERIIAYLTSCGRKKPALLGVNPDSSSDRRKAEFMSRSNLSENIFHNTTGIAACVNDFIERRDEFDSVIFTNDVVMLAAAAIFRAHGLRIPEDFYAISFSDTMLSPIFESPLSPEISTFSIDYHELGRQCGELWYYLAKSASDVAATIRVRANFIPNRSTEFKPLPDSEPISASDSSVPFNFYSDEVVHEIISLENCLIGCDAVDFGILDLLRRGMNRSRVAQELFISEGTLYYRLRRLCKLAGAESVAGLNLLLKKYM